MVDLTTQYLGLTLDTPLVPSSSPITAKLDQLKQLEDLGAGAIVLPSLFEEEIVTEESNMHRFLDHQCIGYGEASSFLPDPIQYQSSLIKYLELIGNAKNALSIPVIASLNGTSQEGWINHARDLEAAGCDAIEINAYYIAANIDESGTEVEQRYIDILRHVKNSVNIPVAMKLSSQFTSPGHFIKTLEKNGAQGVAVFNRFYQPDVNLETLHTQPRITLSNRYESLLRIRWIAMMRNRLTLSIAATGGIHSAQEAIKAVLAGADSVYLCSILLKENIQSLKRIKEDIIDWMTEHEYESIQQMKGSISLDNAIDPSAYVRGNYFEIMHGNTTLTNT